MISAGGLETKLPVTVEDATAHPLRFVRDVEPVISKAGCNAGTCHGSAKGKNGFKLSLRGYDPEFDYQALINDLSGRRFNRVNVDDSLMLLKPTAEVPHEGRQAIKPGSREYQTLRQWIAEGAKYEDPKIGRANKIDILPAEVEMELRAQIERAKAFHLPLTHFDTHMGALTRTPELVNVYWRMGKEYKLPILMERAEGAHHPQGGAPDIEAALITQVISIEPGAAPKDWLKAYEQLLAPLQPGVYQLTVHLAYDDEEMRGATGDHPDWGAAWRQADFEMVQSSEFRQFLKDQGFVLVGWKDLARALPANYGQSQNK